MKYVYQLTSSKPLNIVNGMAYAIGRAAQQREHNKLTKENK